MDNLGLESESVEFKESIGQLDKGIISLISMLNKNGCGTVLFGVRDNGDVIGHDVGAKTLRHITQNIADTVDPPIVAKVEVKLASDSKKYISVSATGTERPYAYKDAVYIRSGEEDRKIPMSELRKIIRSSGDNLVHSLSNNQELSFRELCAILNDNGMHVKDDENLRRNLDLVNSEGMYNIQGQILSDQNPVIITVAVFRGTDRTFISLRTEFSEHSLLTQVHKVMDYVYSLNETHSAVGRRERVDEKLFDEDAFKEAWINACVHNYWMNTAPPMIHIFDDRMEIISNGDKPYWLSEDDFYNGRSMPVNESLMRIFISAHLSEHTGHGIPIIVEKYGRESIKASNCGVTVCIPFTRARVTSRFRSELPVLTDKEKLVLDALKAYPSSNLNDIAEVTGVSRSYVGRVVVKLKGYGLVERIGSNKTGTWDVKE